MTIITSDLLRRLPKAELHCHLDGSVRPATLLELARDQHVKMPQDDAEALADYMRVDDARTLEDYLARFAVTLSVMQTAEAMERTAYELAEDCAREGVRYVEVRYAPILNITGGLTLAQAVEHPLRGLRRAEREYGITSRVIICALRNRTPETSLQLARLAVDFKDAGVVGFDLAGGEAGHPASDHRAAFAHAIEHG
ncbi:MAG: adenosine deaminase, partial [Gemmatimonadota bacterium]|nr:adenosine deaminase [Gemmatimonadota bacterium]